MMNDLKTVPLSDLNSCVAYSPCSCDRKLDETFAHDNDLRLIVTRLVQATPPAPVIISKYYQFVNVFRSMFAVGPN